MFSSKFKNYFSIINKKTAINKSADLLLAQYRRWIIWFHQAPHICSPNPADHAFHFCVNKHKCIPLLKLWNKNMIHSQACSKWQIWGYLGCFIHPSKRTCPLASFICSAGEFAFSRHKASEKWVAYSAGRPQVAGRQGEHLGWHRVWHSKTQQKRREWMC